MTMLRIAIFGAECTGKTTLSQNLATYYQTEWVPEYAREYACSKPVLDVTDVLPIMYGQIKAEKKALAMAKAKGKPLIICDTIPLSSIAYSQYYNKTVPAKAEELAVCDYSLYFLTDLGVDWENDGVRGMHINRPVMHSLFKKALENRKISYVLLQGSKKERMERALYFIENLLILSRNTLPK